MTTKVQRAVSSNRLTSKEPLSEGDLILLVPMLNDMFRNRTGLLEKRSHALGRRNPATLPGKDTKSESRSTNQMKSREWSKLRRQCAAVNSTGMKYV